MKDDFIVTMDDISNFHCGRGTIAWFKQHNLNFKDFRKNGILASVLLATGDPFAIEVVEFTKVRLNG